jgi:uncharacterized membrane protein
MRVSELMAWQASVGRDANTPVQTSPAIFGLEVLVAFPAMVLKWWFTKRAEIKNPLLGGALILLAGLLARIILRMSLGLEWLAPRR